ncbi:MAG: hypothetical protein Q7S33_00790 [Nanoarchaeota archaeon]|nr:hypothetical protein [Nanoarchaeota archaeon]
MKKGVNLFLIVFLFGIFSIGFVNAASLCGKANGKSYASADEVIAAGACSSGNILQQNGVIPSYSDFKWKWQCIGTIPTTEDCSANYVLDGDGSSENPYQIKNCLDLDVIEHYLNENYILMNNINCDRVYWPGYFIPIGSSSKPFTGIFDGNGKIIKNLEIPFTYSSDNKHASIFSVIGVGGIVKNLGVVDIYIQGSSPPGNIYSANYIGGISGLNKGTISKCFVKRAGIFKPYWINSAYNLDGDSYIGGISGANEGLIENCYTQDLVIKGIYYMGGISGANFETGILRNSYSTSQIIANDQWNAGYGGGLIGLNGVAAKGLGAGGDIINSFAVGPIGCLNSAFICSQSSNGDYSMGILVGEANTGGILSGNYYFDYLTSPCCTTASLRVDAAIGAIRTGTMSATSQNLNYFKGIGIKTKAPFSSWSWITWSEVSGDFPKLNWEIVTTPYCGDGIVQLPEVCDSGVNNGVYEYCNSDCSGLGARCGDGICQSIYGENTGLCVDCIDSLSLKVSMWWTKGTDKITQASIGDSVNINLEKNIYPTNKNINYKIIKKSTGVTVYSETINSVVLRDSLDWIPTESGTYYFIATIDSTDYNSQSYLQGELVVGIGCGSSGGVTLATMPTTNLCSDTSSPTVSTTISPAGWSWNCGGIICYAIKSTGGSCNNGVKDSGEDCDGSDFGTNSRGITITDCVSYNSNTYKGGSLSCSSCKIITTSCILKEAGSTGNCNCAITADNCNPDGTGKKTYTCTWTGNPADRTTLNCPATKLQDCSIPITELPFFTWVNMTIVIAVLVAFYIAFGRQLVKKKKRK